MKIKVLLGVLVALSISCTREKGQTARIVFEVPPAQQKSSDFTLLSLDDIDDDFDFYEEDWLQVPPSGITTGTTPINCYAVMVGGPEFGFRQNYCGRKNAASTSTNTIIDKMIEFGPWIGLVPATATGTTISMEVPSGSDRVFHLVGFHATDAASCVDLRKANPNKGGLTKPYILGTVGRVQLEPGNTVPVVITQTLDSSKWFDECQFTDASNESGEYAASVVSLDKLTRPSSSVIASASTSSDPANTRCTPFMFRLLDAYRNPSRSKSDQTVTLKKCLDVGGGSPPDCWDKNNPATNLTATMNTFSNFNSCVTSTDTDGDSSFTIPSGEKNIMRWVRNPVAPQDHMFLRAETSGLNLKDPEKWLVRTTSQYYWTIDAPKNMVAGQCYKIVVSHRGHDGDDTTAATLDNVEVLDEASGTSVDITSTSLFTSLASCTSNTPIPGGTFPTGSPVQSLTLYFKPPASYDLKIIASHADSSVDEGKLRIDAKTGTLVPNRLRFLGPQALKAGVCHGPVYVNLVNENGSAVNWTSATSKQIVLTQPSAANPDISNQHIEIYSASGCGGGSLVDMALATAGVSITTNNYQAKFYIKATSGATGRRNVEFTDSAGLKGRAEFELY